jgi:hypothetical protein
MWLIDTIAASSTLPAAMDAGGGGIRGGFAWGRCGAAVAALRKRQCKCKCKGVCSPRCQSTRSMYLVALPAGSALVGLKPKD